MNFQTFKLAVATQFERMCKAPSRLLYRSGFPKDTLWDIYLESFPEGSDPIFRTRRGHDCTCCKQFIRAIGNVVAIIDNKIVSIWDIKIPNEPVYQQVADHMANAVKSFPIENVFLHYEKTAGTDKTRDLLAGVVTSWDHFFVHIPKQHVLALVSVRHSVRV